jgi:glycogen debranching enzyme
MVPPPPQDLLDGARSLLLRNRKQGYDPVLKREYCYTCPSGGHYPWQWFWDSCFHAIALCYVDPDQAKEELRTLLAAQHEDGFVPHVTHWGTRWWARFLVDLPAYGQSKLSWKPKSTALIQPPVLAQAARKVAEATGDRGFLQEVLPKVRRYYLWLHDKRDPDGDGLISVISPYETGMDQLPAYDEVLGAGNPSRLGLHLRDRFLDLRNLFLGGNYDLPTIFRRDAFNVEDVMVNCLYAQGLRDTAAMCSMAGDEAGADAFARMAERTEQAVLAKCYDRQAGVFWSLGTKAERPLRVLTVTSLFPVVLDSIDKKRVDELAALMQRDDAFWLPYPLPSVARSEPSFRPNASFLIWRGASWVNINWAIAHGLRRHGYGELAGTITQRTESVIRRSGFREFYNPLTGVGLGAKNFGWSTLVLDMPR